MRPYTQHEVIVALAYKVSQRDGVRYQVYGQRRNGAWVYTLAPTFAEYKKDGQCLEEVEPELDETP